MNWPSVIILGLIIAAVVAVVITGIIKRKKGKSSCSCGGACGVCPMSETCHSEKKL